jgi:hypothetical protein
MAPQIQARSLHPANRHGMVRGHVGIIGARHRLVTASTAGVSVGRTGIRADYEKYRGGNLQVRSLPVSSPGALDQRTIDPHSKVGHATLSRFQYMTMYGDVIVSNRACIENNEEYDARAVTFPLGCARELTKPLPSASDTP